MNPATNPSSSAAPTQPRLRADLLAEAIEDGGQRFIDVLDPQSGHGFRFYEAEYALACGMDGQRDVAGLVRWAEDELGLKTTATELSSVIATLGGLGYLDGDDHVLACLLYTSRCV